MKFDVSKIITPEKIKKMKFKNTNLTFEQVLKNEVVRFKSILQKYIEEYYNSYKPKVYNRGSAYGNLSDCLTVDDLVEVSANGKQLICKLKINENAIHRSIGKENYHNTNVFWLMDSGWTVNKNEPFANIYRFGWFDGAGYITKAVEEFHNTNKYGLTVEIKRPLIWFE